MLNLWLKHNRAFLRLLPAVAGLLVATTTLAGCQSIENYQEQSEPLFSGAYAGPPPTFNGTLKIISWNIKFSEQTETAIAELSEVEALKDADILLLQEMDEAGAEVIAQALHYNYVYFPASIHSHHGKNFGNAILSMWPLSNPQKIILPHQNPKNNQIRIATSAVVTVGDIHISTYSVHTETVWLSPTKRHEQILKLIESMSNISEYIIVGGDFNTVTPQSIVNLDRRFEQIGLTRASTGAGHTFERGGLNFTMDHIYTNGMAARENGVWADTQASDHYPVWAIVAVSREPG